MDCKEEGGDHANTNEGAVKMYAANKHNKHK